jgi:hypothetical protein
VKYLCISGEDCTGGTPADSVTTYTRGTKVDLYTLAVPEWEDHFFANTYFTDAGMVYPISEVTMDKDQTVYTAYLDLAGTVGSVELLESDDHYAYLIGYTDGTVHPLGDLSRAETATVFFRLLTAEVRDGSLTAESEFDDVTTEMWCDKAIATLARLNILKGRGEGVFDPEATITRAEFAAICARFDDSEVETGSTFSDIADCWAKEEIQRAAALGWVTGYPDGTFRPYDNITRSEAATLINRMLQRLPQTAEDLLENAVTWPDAPESEWYYLAIEEATNSHAHEADEADGHERWTALTEAPDWKQYQ